MLILGKAGDMENHESAMKYANSLLQTKARLKDAAAELCKDMKLENVVYAEIRLDPAAHLEKDLTLKDVVEATLEGLAMSTLKTKLILVMKRNYGLLFKIFKRIVCICRKRRSSGRHSCWL